MAAVSGFLAKQRTRDAAQWTIHTYQVLDEADAMLQSMVDIQTGARGYMASGEVRFLDPYSHGLARYVVAWERAKVLTADNAIQRERLQALWRMHVDYLVAAGEMIGGRDRVASGEIQISQLLGAFAQGRDKQVMDAYRALNEQFVNTERALLLERQRFAERLNTRWDILLVIGALLALAIPMFVARSLSRSLRKDLDEAIAVAERIAAGDLATRPPPARVPDIDPLLQAVGRMQGVLREQQQALRDAAETAERANAAKRQFLATMNHEIRTPLNGVIGLTRLLQNTELRGEQVDYARRLNSSAGLLLALVNDVLDLSKIEAGRLTLEQADVVLREALSESLDVFLDMARQKGLSMNLVVHPALPRVIVSDGHRLRQVLTNLLGNAVKFTHQGEIVLRAGELRRGPERRLELKVIDSGIGIASESQQNLFMPFSQAETSTARLYQGTGLGLSISREIARAMGGDITLESAPGKGSTFTVELPLVPASTAEATQGAAQPLAASARPLRILVVDDDPVNRIVAEGLLGQLGHHEVTTAEDGEAAVAECTQHPFDLVLMDCQMPVLDGLAATRELRLRGRTMPIVALTAAASQVDRDRCMQAGMDDYIAKPIDPKELARVLRRVAS
jgi:signal transduction histidine kinase